MRRWRHKETGKELRAVIWWEPSSEPFLYGKSSEMKPPVEDTWPERLHAIGALAQVGWLLENEHGIWLGVGAKAAEAFDDLGEWQPPEAKT